MVSCMTSILLNRRSFGVGFPELVDFQIANSHVLDPVLVPLVELGGLDAGDGGAQCSVGSRAVRAHEYPEVEGGP